MKKHLLIISLIYCLFGCTESLDKEIVFFDKIDFNSGNYKIYVFASEGAWIKDYKDFVIEDIETLNKIKDKWVFKNKVPPTSCGYGYNLKLVDTTNILKSVNINFDCEYMSGWIQFPKEYLSEFTESFKPLTKKDINDFSKKYSSESILQNTQIE